MNSGLNRSPVIYSVNRLSEVFNCKPWANLACAYPEVLVRHMPENLEPGDSEGKQSLGIAAGKKVWV
jgi:hypothetical protein